MILQGHVNRLQLLLLLLSGTATAVAASPPTSRTAVASAALWQFLLLLLLKEQSVGDIGILIFCRQLACHGVTMCIITFFNFKRLPVRQVKELHPASLFTSNN